MQLKRGQDVLLFFGDFERDYFLPNDRVIMRYLRPLYTHLGGRPKISGFQMWYILLVKALRNAGYTVHTNAYGLARRNPHYPVGLVGYPSLLDRWKLPNPAILGPGFFDHPQQCLNLMQDPRFRSYIVTCDWMMQLFQPVYGEACVMWHAGIDQKEWPDYSKEEKTVDVLIYDKIRWDRQRLVPSFLEPILQHLDKSGHTHETLRYGAYTHAMFHNLLKRSRTMLFLCEHETQGMAYQQALSSNIPLLAWDPGWWVDPNRSLYSTKPIPAASIPYFSAECGERFTNAEDFAPVFDRFWEQRERYCPRRFVERELSFDTSAKLYMTSYDALFNGQE